MHLWQTKDKETVMVMNLHRKKCGVLFSQPVYNKPLLDRQSDLFLINRLIVSKPAIPTVWAVVPWWALKVLQMGC